MYDVAYLKERYGKGKVWQYGRKKLLLKCLIIHFKLIDAVIFVQVNMVRGRAGGADLK